MWHYTIKRIGEIFPATFGILLLTFLLFNVVGGSPAEVILGKNASAEALINFDAIHGYDKPLFIGRWSITRALPLFPVKNLVFDQPNQSAALPLASHLPAGTYQINSTAIEATLYNPLSETTTIVKEQGKAPLSFTVPEAWQAHSLRILPTTKKIIRLRKKNQHWFDTQFVNYLRALGKGDLGFSLEHHLPVAVILRQGAGPSLALTIPILIGSTILAVMLSMISATWRNTKIDRLVLMGSTLLMSVNYVVWVLVGQFLLAYKWRLFPVWGFNSITCLILPVAIGICSGIGRDVRYFRAALLDEIYKPHVRTATAKGLHGTRIMTHHVLLNSLIPIITYVSLSVPFLFTGSLLLESFFGIPGLGNVTLNAIHSSDMAVVRAVVLMGALFYQAVNLLTDLCYGWLDPRVRLH